MKPTKLSELSVDGPIGFHTSVGGAAESGIQIPHLLYSWRRCSTSGHGAREVLSPNKDCRRPHQAVVNVWVEDICE
jgi:hypothetical protein